MSSATHKLPEDIWVEIVKYITVRQDTHNLSLTCRVTRYATLPLLFQALRFDASRHPDSAWRSFLVYSSRRAKSLLENPHLLFHVLEVHLCLRKAFRGTLWRSTSDRISTAISASPRIRKLSLESCIITPGLHQIIYGKRSLQSLEICHTELSPLLRPQPGVWLTRLSYRHTHNVSPSWFMQLLDLCLSNLISLTVDDEKVIRHFLSISRHQLLALRTLAVPDFPRHMQAEVWNLFIMCPNLRTLRISQPFESMCPDQALTKLEFLEGEMDTLCDLLPGRSIHTVHLTDFRYFPSRANASLLRAGRVPVRHLTFTKTSSFQDDELQRLANGFGDLLSLSLFLMPNHRDFETFAASLDAVTDYLSQWPQLQEYRIFSREDFAQDLSQKYSRCPIAPSGNPRNRGHSSLVKFQFARNLAWLWSSSEGWTLREMDGTQYPYVPQANGHVSPHNFGCGPFHARLCELFESPDRSC